MYFKNHYMYPFVQTPLNSIPQKQMHIVAWA